MKYIKRIVVIVLSLFMGIGNCFALTDDEWLEAIENGGDVYVYYQFKENMPTSTTPYRLNVTFNQISGNPSLYYKVIPLTKEDFQTLKPHQDVINEYYNQYQEHFSTYRLNMMEYTTRISEIEAKGGELYKLYEQETDEEKKAQIMEQINALSTELNEWFVKLSECLQENNSLILSIDPTIVNSIKAMKAVSDKYQVENQMTDQNDIEITTPGYYLVSLSIDADELFESTTFSWIAFYGAYYVVEVPEPPKEEVVEEPDVENPGTGIQNMFIGGGIVIVTSIFGMYFIRKKKIFVK